MRWSRGVGILALAIAAPGAAQAPQQLEVTLNEAIQRALQVQPLMVSARGAQRTSGAARTSAWGVFLPSVTLGAFASKNSAQRFDPNSNKLIPPIPNYGSSLGANISVITGVGQLANIKAANAALDASEAGVITQRFRTELDTKQAFYDASATEELVRVAESQVRRARQQLQISIDKLHAGSATRSDSLRSTVDYGNARIVLLQAKANLATAQANLGRQIGIDQSVRALPDSALPPLPDTTALRGSAIVSAPQVQQAEASASAARASQWAARAQYLPSLTFSLGTNRQDTIFNRALVSNEVHNWRIGVSWPIFDGFKREQAQISASVNRENAEAAAADTRRQVNAQLTQQLAQVATAWEQIGIARDNLAAATEDLRVQNERYRVGAATILDLLTSQAALTQAEVNLVQTRFNYLIARAQVEAVVGRTL
ncbi:MAG TPA: TolC family protein [Gemmatimonadales bacterium]|nr:TolC family protein [Gemmatimonadales bacterium]